MPASDLVVHSAGGLIFAGESTLEGSGGRLRTYAASDGRLLGTQPLFPGEVLLDVDDPGRIFLMGEWGVVRVLGPDYTAMTELAIPTPDTADPALTYPWLGAPQPALPIVDRRRGQLLAFSGRRITTIDVPSGRVVREIEVPGEVPGGSISGASMDLAGSTLYLAMADTALNGLGDGVSSRLVALDATSAEVLDAQEMRSPIVGWLPTGDGVIVEGNTYKHRGSDHRVWKKGREVARRTESNIGWTAYDSTRDRVIGAPMPPQSYPFANVMVGRGGTLDLLASLHADATYTAYDAVTDQLYARGPDPEQLLAVDAAAIGPPDGAARGAAADVLGPDIRVRPFPEGSLVPRIGAPPILGGSFERPVDAGMPTPEDPEWGSAVSRDGGATWEELGAVGIPAWPDKMVLGPDEPGQRTPNEPGQSTVFGALAGMGIFRSDDDGRSWVPISDGLETMWVREIVVSPDYAVDGTLFANSELSYLTEFEDFGGSEVNSEESALAWRSLDRGTSWEPIGPYSAMATSPNYRVDRTLMGFERGTFHVSTDAGDTWQPRGSLPDIGQETFAAGRLWVIPPVGGDKGVLLTLATSGSEMGGMQGWNEAGARLFRSIDGGSTWDLAWGTYGNYAWDGVLLGPYVPPSLDGSARDSVWVFQLQSGQATLISTDGGAQWDERQLTEGDPGRSALGAPDPEELLGMLPGGDLLVGDKEGIRRVPVDLVLRRRRWPLAASPFWSLCGRRQPPFLRDSMDQPAGSSWLARCEPLAQTIARRKALQGRYSD